jgi:hypothetical protein
MDGDRDEAARRRDQEAKRRDLRAVVRDRAAGPDLPDGERRAREEAAADRRAAAADRRAAAGDREGASEPPAEPGTRPRLRLVSEETSDGG